MMESFSEQSVSFPWALKLKKSYKRLRKQQIKGNSHELLRNFIKRSVKITLKEIQDYCMIEDLQHKMSFIEGLIYTFNEENAKLPNIMPNFDDLTLPIMEKYLEVLVFQSQKNNSSKESMQKLTEFLKSLPCHPSLKISNGARCKSLLTQLLTNHQRKSKAYDASDADKQTSESSDEYIHSDSSCSNPPKGSHQNVAVEANSDSSLEDDSSEEEFSPSRTKPVLNSTSLTSLKNNSENDDENNSSSVSAKQSSKSSLETDDSYNAESIVSNKELEDTSTSSANNMQIVTKKKLVMLYDTECSGKEILSSRKTPCINPFAKKPQISEEDEDSSASEKDTKMTNLDEANGDEFTLSENKPVRTSLSLKKHIEIDEVEDSMVSEKKSLRKNAQESSKDEFTSSKKKPTRISTSRTRNRTDSSLSEKETEMDSLEEILCNGKEHFPSEKKAAQNSRSKNKMRLQKRLTHRSSDEVESSQDECFLPKKRIKKLENINVSISSRNKNTGSYSDEIVSSEEECPAAMRSVCISPSSKKITKTIPKKTTCQNSDRGSSPTSSEKGNKNEHEESSFSNSEETYKLTRKKDLNEFDCDDEEYILKEEPEKTSSKKNTKADNAVIDTDSTPNPKYKTKKKYIVETDSSEEESFPSTKKLARTLSSREFMRIDDKEDFSEPKKKILIKSSDIESDIEKNSSPYKSSSRVSTSWGNQILVNRENCPVPEEQTMNINFGSGTNHSSGNAIQIKKSKDLGEEDMFADVSNEMMETKPFTGLLSKSAMPNCFDVPSGNRVVDRCSSSSKYQGNPGGQFYPDLIKENRLTSSTETISKTSELPLTSPPNLDCKTLNIQSEPRSSFSLRNLQMILRRRFRNPFITLTEKQRNYNVLRLLTKKRKFRQPSWTVTKQARSLNISDSCTGSKGLKDVTGPSTAKISEPLENSPDFLSNCFQEAKNSAGFSSTDNHLRELQKNMQGNIFGCEASTSDVELMEEIESNAHFWSNPEFNPQELTSPSYLNNNLTKTTDKSEVNDGKRLKLSISKDSESTENKENRRCRPALNIKYTPLKGLKRKAIHLESSPGSLLTSLPACEEATASPAKKKTLGPTNINTPFSYETLKTTWETLGKMLPPCWLKILQDHVQAHNALDQIPYKEYPNQPMPVTLLCGCVNLPNSETK